MRHGLRVGSVAARKVLYTERVLWPVDLDPKRDLLSAALNQAKRLGVSRRTRGCHLTLDHGAQHAADVALASFRTIQAALGDLHGKTGIEVGPGDNLGVAHCCLAGGAASVTAIEQYATVRESAAMASIIGSAIGGNPGRPDLRVVPFEEYPGPAVDFIYSIDVIEHVADVPAAFRTVSRLLKPGGASVHSIDFAGHNAYAQTGIAFLACPDAIWDLLHSHLVTTNRVRFSEAIQSMRDAGLELESVSVTRRASLEDLARITPHVLPRWKHLSDDDLTVLQAVICARKPA